VFDNLFQIVACVFTAEQCSAINRLSIASVLQLCLVFVIQNCVIHILERAKYCLALPECFLLPACRSTSQCFAMIVLGLLQSLQYRLFLNQTDKHRENVLNFEFCNHVCRKLWQHWFSFSGSFFLPGNATQWRNWATWKYHVCRGIKHIQPQCSLLIERA